MGNDFEHIYNMIIGIRIQKYFFSKNIVYYIDTAVVTGDMVMSIKKS